MLKGRVRLDLKRGREVIAREEGENTITPWFSTAINKGNWNYLMNYSKILPLDQWFAGCLLTDKAGDPNSMMIAHDATVIAQANSTAYSGENLRRGSGNSNYTVNIPGGKRFVFDWSQPQGCGDIRAIHLTRGIIGAADMSDGSRTPDAGCVEIMSPEDVRFTPSIMSPSVNIIDLDREKAFYVYYSSGHIYISEYEINTYRYHLTGKIGDAIRLIQTHDIEQTIASYDLNYCSMSYTGDYIYIFQTGNNSSSLDEYKITVENWTCTKTSHTYSNFTFGYHNYWYGIPKDIMPVIEGYFFALNYAGTKIAKINLSDDSDIEQFDCPVPSSVNRGIKDGPSLILPNGDFYKFNIADGINPAIYYHDGQFYEVIAQYRVGLGFIAGGSNLAIGNFGTALAYLGADGRFIPWVDVLYPFVSSCYNLSSMKRKTNDMTMTLTYDVYETQN